MHKDKFLQTENYGFSRKGKQFVMGSAPLNYNRKQESFPRDKVPTQRPRLGSQQGTPEIAEKPSHLKQKGQPAINRE